jgi:murein DD-endopeptidase MepM/ murein hydrolase activator NlpD
VLPCYYTLLTSPFGYRDAPTAGASTYHEGVDLAGPEGTPIVASRSGTVTIARYSNSAGFYVSINHGDGFSSVYMHMTHYVVSVGQHVSQGQLIGYMGSTGISTGSHLHFGISQNGVYVNPALYVPLY